MFNHPTHQGAAIAAIYPDAAQLLAVTVQPLEDEARAVTFLHRSGSDDDQQQQAESINQQMPLAPFDLFRGVIASNASDFSGFDALTIETSGGRMLMASGPLTDLSAHGVVEALPVAAQAPQAKVMIDALPFWIFTRQHPPFDTADNNVENGIDDHSDVQRTRASARFRTGNQVFDKMPLAVSQIGWVDLVRHTQNLPDRSG